MSYTVAVITVSDKGARGERVDTSGPAVCAIAEKKGWTARRPPKEVFSSDCGAAIPGCSIAF